MLRHNSARIIANMHKHPGKLLLSITDAAESLSLGRTAVYELLNAGELTSVHVGRRRLIPAEAVELYARRLIDSQRVAS